MAEGFNCPWCRGTLTIEHVTEYAVDYGQEKVTSYVTKRGNCDSCNTDWIIDMQYRETNE